MDRAFGEAGRLGVCIPYEAFARRLGGPSQLGRVLATLTVREKLQPGAPKNVAPRVACAYRHVKDDNQRPFLLFPRPKQAVFSRVLDGVQAGNRENVPLPPPRALSALACEIAMPLYPYQEAVVDFLFAADTGPLCDARVAAGTAQAYLQMDTGLGKTRVGCAVAARSQTAALVVVPTKAIREQWVDEFAEIYPELSVACYDNPTKGSRRVPPGPKTHDIVVAIINTVRKKPPDFLEGYGLVVLDEAHEYHSPENCKALWLAVACERVLGLSATPEERSDGMDRFVKIFIGRPVVAHRDIPGYDIAHVQFRGLVREVAYTGPEEFTEEVRGANGTVSAISTIGNLIRDPARLRLIAAEVARLYHLHETLCERQCGEYGLGPRPDLDADDNHPPGEVRRHGIYVFAEHRDYLPAIRDALLEHFEAKQLLVPELPERIEILRGGVGRAELEHARKCYVVPVTYGFGRRGISLPDMTAIVFATPRRNGMKQILGRILRRGSDERILRMVVDIVDYATPLRSQNTNRRAAYKQKGYSIYRCITRHPEFAPGVAVTLRPAARLIWQGDVDLPDPQVRAAAQVDGGPAQPQPPPPPNDEEKNHGDGRVCAQAREDSGWDSDGGGDTATDFDLDDLLDEAEAAAEADFPPGGLATVGQYFVESLQL